MHHNQSNSRSSRAGHQARPDPAPALRLFNAKSVTKIGCWNVRTLTNDCAQIALVREFVRYKMDILAISEMRWKDSGTSTISDGAGEQLKVMYSGGATHHRGVGFVLSRTADRALKSFNPVSDRIAVAEFDSFVGPIFYIAVYAPTDVSSDDDKDIFYEGLQSVVKTFPRGARIVIAGDFNAQCKGDPAAWGGVIGPHCVGKINDNGIRLLSFASQNSLVVTNSLFEHKDAHKVSWYSNDKRTVAQLDYVLISKRWVTSVHDTRVMRGADVNSDHHLVICKIQMKLRTSSKPKHKPKPDLSALRSEDCRQTFQVALQNRFARLEPLDTPDPEALWTDFREGIVAVADTVVPRAKRARPEWLSVESTNLIDKRRAAKLVNKPEYNRLNRLANRAVRRDRENLWAKTADSMERAMNRGDSRSFYKTLNGAVKGRTSAGGSIRQANGNLCKGPEETLHRWAEHFADLLNCDDPDTPDETLEPAAREAIPDSDVLVDPPSVAEVLAAIRRLRSGKAGGCDGIAPEMLKYGGEVVAGRLHEIIAKVWESGSAPAQWKEAHIVPLFKKGDKAVTSNYRGISLLSIAGKVYTAILHSRVVSLYEQCCRENQAGFRRGRGCSDQIFTTRQVIERRHAYNQSTAMVFVDFKAAFDSVHRESLWKILLATGFPAKIVDLIKDLYTGGCCRIKANNDVSDSFEVRTGVRQGCILSPCLFNLAIDWVMNRTVGAGDGVQLADSLRISDLAYADDVVLLSESKEAAQCFLTRLAKYAGQIGLRINVGKTKAMSVCGGNLNLSLEGGPIKEVSSFCYLGSNISADGKACTDVTSRVGKAAAVFNRLYGCLWKRKEISLSTKMRVYNAAVLPVLLYGADCWPICAKEMKRLEVFNNRCLRSILNIRLADRVNLQTLRLRACNQPRVEDTLRTRRLKLLGHVARMPVERYPIAAFFSEPLAEWKRRAGGQTKTWRMLVEEDLRRVHPDFSVEDARATAQNRGQWAAMVRDAVLAPKANGRSIRIRR